jgi:type IV secretion system protein VirB1
MIDLLFIHICSTPGVHPKTTAAIIQHESAFDEFALNINTSGVDLKSLGISKPKSKEEAEIAAEKLISLKVNFDAGPMQINFVNFKGYGLTARSVFDPCTNIRVGTAILKSFYRDAEKSLGPGQEALKAALSAYNTGNHSKGFENGYVAKFYGKRTLRREDPFKAPIIASDGIPRPRKDPYSASILGDSSTTNKGEDTDDNRSN